MGWNVFDFTLVILGILGLLVNIFREIQAAQDADVSADARLIRFARIFRAMRLMRLVRLVRFIKLSKAKMNAMDFNQEVSEHMQKINVLKCFIRGHLGATKEFIRFFGSEDSVEAVEMARCILQSQVSVYKAMCLAVAEERTLGKRMLRGVQNVHDSKVVVEQLSAFVMDAHAGGIITHREAHSILHPLNQFIKNCSERIQMSHQGYTERSNSSSTVGSPARKSAGDFLRGDSHDSDDGMGDEDAEDADSDCTSDSDSCEDEGAEVSPEPAAHSPEQKPKLSDLPNGDDPELPPGSVVTTPQAGQ